MNGWMRCCLSEDGLIGDPMEVDLFMEHDFQVTINKKQKVILKFNANDFERLYSLANNGVLCNLKFLEEGNKEVEWMVKFDKLKYAGGIDKKLLTPISEEYSMKMEIIKIID